MSAGTQDRPNGSLADRLLESAADVATTGRSFLASERGKNVRRGVAAALIIGAPILSELPVFRTTSTFGGRRRVICLECNTRWIADGDDVELVPSAQAWGAPIGMHPSRLG